MSKKIKNFLIYFISPIIIVIGGFIFSKTVGTIALVAYFLLLYYLMLPNIYRIKGSKSYGDDKLADAIKWYGKAYKTKRGGTGTAVSLAYLMLKKGDIEGSESLFTKTYEASDTSEEFRNVIKSNIALVKWKKGNIDEAIEMLEKLIAEFKTTNIYVSLGYLYIAKGDLEKALEFNLEALEYNDANSIILDNLGETYYWLERYEEAEDIYEKMINKNPKFPEPYYHYGIVLEKLDRRDEAIQMVKTATNFKTNFLSSVTDEQITEKLNELTEKG